MTSRGNRRRVDGVGVASFPSGWASSRSRRRAGPILKWYVFSTARAASTASAMLFSWLLVQRDQHGEYWGAKKVVSRFAVLTVPKWSVTPVESCQSVVQRSLWGRLGSILDVGSRLHRLRGRIHHRKSIIQVLSQPNDLSQSCQSFDFRALWEPQAPAYAV